MMMVMCEFASFLGLFRFVVDIDVSVRYDYKLTWNPEEYGGHLIFANISLDDYTVKMLK